MASLQASLESIWKKNEDAFPFVKRSFMRLYKRLYVTVDYFLDNNIGSYASALTYNTMLAAVPVLAIFFAIARGFGFDNIIEERLRSSLKYASPEFSDMVISFVSGYLEHTKSGIFVGVGLLLLFYTIINLTMNIETAFNLIWKVNASRNIYRRISDYISVFLLLPLLLVITSGFNVFIVTFSSFFSNYFIIGSTVKLFLTISPFLLTCVAFTLLYKLMPNTHVHWGACIAPGILAGIMFQIMEYFYIHYQIKLSSYNAIYGSFAAIPLLLIFLQFTWYICLIGCQMSYANQCVKDYAFEKNTKGMSRRYRDSMALFVMSSIAKRFAEGRGPLSSRAWARSLQLPETMVSNIIQELSNVGLLATVLNERGTEVKYLPAVDIHCLTVKYVINKLESHGTEYYVESWDKKNPDWKRLRHMLYNNEDGLIFDFKQ